MDEFNRPAQRSSRTQWKNALSRWENEGGAIAHPRWQARDAGRRLAGDESLPGLTEPELLRVRVIALENLLIAILACASDDQLNLAVEMVSHIAPRPGFTRHPMTLRAAAQMRGLLARSNHFRLPDDGDSALAPLQLELEGLSGP